MLRRAFVKVLAALPLALATKSGKEDSLATAPLPENQNIYLHRRFAHGLICWDVSVRRGASWWVFVGGFGNERAPELYAIMGIYHVPVRGPRKQVRVIPTSVWLQLRRFLKWHGVSDISAPLYLVTH